MKTHLVDGMQYFNFKDGAIIALLSIVMVFVVLLIIILLTELVSKAVPAEKEAAIETNASTERTTTSSPLNVNDEDAMVACLIASIDYRNETKKHIEVKSVREVK